MLNMEAVSGEFRLLDAHILTYSITKGIQSWQDVV